MYQLLILLKVIKLLRQENSIWTPLLKLCYSLKLLGAWQSYGTVMAAKDLQLLGYESKTNYDDLKIIWILVSEVTPVLLLH